MPPLKRKNPWIQVVLFSLPLIGIFGVYHNLATPQYFSLVEFGVKGLTHAGLMLIACSLVLGPTAKFFDSFDKYLHYRKQLGITGFYYVLIHGFIASVLYLWPSPAFFLRFANSIILGLLSLYLLALCTEWSEVYIIRKVGSKVWRKMLRWMSYSAFVLSLIHIWLIEHQGWESLYFSDPNRFLPPLSLLTFFLGSLVVAWRLCVMVYDIVTSQTKAKK